MTNDPRSETRAADLDALHVVEMRLMQGIGATRAAIDGVVATRDAVRRATSSRPRTPALDAAMAAFDTAVRATLTALTGARGLSGQLADLQFADWKPTASTVAAVDAQCQRADAGLTRLRQFTQTDLAAVNAALVAAGSAAVPPPAAMPARACGSGR